MLPIYSRAFEQFRIVDSEGMSLIEQFVPQAQWLARPGCLFQRNDLVLDRKIQTECVMKAGFFVTVVLKGAGQGSARTGAGRFRYAENTIVAMAVREPTSCASSAARGTHMHAAGLAFPWPSIARLGLQQDFLELFAADEAGSSLVSFKAPPRILAMAGEMLSPPLEGAAGELLLSAHATEILVRVMAAVRQRASIDAAGDRRQFRLRSVKDIMDADLRRAWSIPELARHAGVSRRSFNTQFRRAFGISASEYLRTKRLETARDAMIQQGLSVNEAAYLVGYANPANFATAFRKHFGHVPSHYRN